MPRSPYTSMYDRLVANTHEPENAQACWVWKGRRCRYWYGKVNLYVPGLGKVVHLYSHVLMYCLMASKAKTPNELYLAYLEMRTSELEVDHLCTNPPCLFPDHLEAVTKQRNNDLRGRRP